MMVMHDGGDDDGDADDDDADADDHGDDVDDGVDDDGDDANASSSRHLRLVGQVSLAVFGSFAFFGYTQALEGSVTLVAQNGGTRHTEHRRTSHGTP